MEGWVLGVWQWLVAECSLESSTPNVPKDSDFRCTRRMSWVGLCIMHRSKTFQTVTDQRFVGEQPENESNRPENQNKLRFVYNFRWSAISFRVSSDKSVLHAQQHTLSRRSLTTRSSSDPAGYAVPYAEPTQRVNSVRARCGALKNLRPRLPALPPSPAPSSSYRAPLPGRKTPT